MLKKPGISLHTMAWELNEAQKHQLKIYERQERLDAFMRENDPDYVETDPALKVQKPVAIGPPKYPKSMKYAK